MTGTIWDAVLGRIETKVNRNTYYNWFERTALIGDDGGVIAVRVPDAMVVEWLTKHYAAVLDEALTEAGIERSEVYIINVVKHFKWAPSSNGKTRIGNKPLVPEINACRPWLNAELDLIKPKVLICLGATAAQSLLGRNFRITRQRGQLVPSPLAPKVMATLHPSAILRSRGKQLRKAQMQALIGDLTQAAHFLKETS